MIAHQLSGSKVVHSSRIYVVYCTVAGRIGTAENAEERDELCKAAYFKPGSGEVYWLKYSIRHGKNNFGRWQP